MSRDDNKNDNFNCSEIILANEGYYIKNDWDEWIEEWKYVKNKFQTQ